MHFFNIHMWIPQVRKLLENSLKIQPCPGAALKLTYLICAYLSLPIPCKGKLIHQFPRTPKEDAVNYLFDDYYMWSVSVQGDLRATPLSSLSSPVTAETIFLPRVACRRKVEACFTWERALNKVHTTIVKCSRSFLFLDLQSRTRLLEVKTEALQDDNNWREYSQRHFVRTLPTPSCERNFNFTNFNFTIMSDRLVIVSDTDTNLYLFVADVEALLRNKKLHYSEVSCYRMEVCGQMFLSGQHQALFILDTVDDKMSQLGLFQCSIPHELGVGEGMRWSFGGPRTLPLLPLVIIEHEKEDVGRWWIDDCSIFFTDGYIVKQVSIGDSHTIMEWEIPWTPIRTLPNGQTIIWINETGSLLLFCSETL